MIVVGDVVLVFILVFKGCYGFEVVVIGGQYFGDENILIFIVVDICYICFYRGFVDGVDLIDQVFFESVILLIDVKVVVFEEVIGNKKVFLVIIVDIVYGNFQIKFNYIIINICFFVYIYKLAFFVVY